MLPSEGPFHRHHYSCRIKERQRGSEFDQARSPSSFIPRKMSADLAHTINPDQATFLGFGLEGIFYGKSLRVHLLLFGTAAFLFCRPRVLKNHTIIPIIFATIILLALCTIHFALNFDNVYVSTMVSPRPHISGETHKLIVADSSFILADFVGQLVLIYRCYLVWAQNVWIIILPFLIALGALGNVWNVRYRDCYENQSHWRTSPYGPRAHGRRDIFALDHPQLHHFGADRRPTLVDDTRARQLRPLENALHGRQRADSSTARDGIIIESGALFLVVQFIFIVLFAIGHPAQALMEPIAVQVYAIAPLLIVVRVATGNSYEQTTTTSLGSSNPTRETRSTLNFTAPKVHKVTETKSSVSDSEFEMGPAFARGLTSLSESESV
ncbi:unnamed protein product [Mycena citricolor]|uniref:Uncharacterized protein n=1 Tax=Mycena citricolor TaxID=2018698 RepID=A0AAD2Q5Q6_9AGAR|nr:unnamed protein product [Mycena citricolor]